MTEVATTLPDPPISQNLSSETSSEDVETHPRLADYKARSVRCSQEERRFNLLLEQKQRRDESFNESRGLIEAIAHIEEAEEVEDEFEMEWKEIEKAKNKSGYFDKLMFSEWLIEIPKDLEDSWYMVPCPKGNRTMVVATRGSTKAYNKYGCYKSTFQSALPGGCKGTNMRAYTILDCVWHGPSRTYYILDVLAWNNQSFLECETEFRFFWLQTRIQETKGISEKSELNDNAFILLPHHSCDRETLTTIMAMHPPFPDENLTLDGLLFYHMRCHYKPGTTPLVGWLKPFMLPEMLDISVADPYLALKPPDYENLLSHIEQKSPCEKNRIWYKKKKKRKSKNKEEKMEVSLVIEDSVAEKQQNEPSTN